jgi:hypothetical protein
MVFVSYVSEKSSPAGIDPELLFVTLVKKYKLLTQNTLECCVCLDARPVWRRGKWEGQTTIGFRMGEENSPENCWKQSETPSILLTF